MGSAVRVWGLIAAVAGVLAGCAAPGPRTTRLQPEDVDRIIPEVTQSLAESRWLGERGPGSPAAVLVALPPTNLSNERLSASDQWVPVTRVFTHPGLLEIMRGRNVTAAVTPRERADLVRDALGRPERLGPEAGAAEGLVPTHGLKTEFRSRTRTAALGVGGLGSGRDGPADARRDFFQVTYTVVDLSTGEAVWATSAEWSRVGVGLLAD